MRRSFTLLQPTKSSPSLRINHHYDQSSFTNYDKSKWFPASTPRHAEDGTSDSRRIHVHQGQQAQGVGYVYMKVMSFHAALFLPLAPKPYSIFFLEKARWLSRQRRQPVLSVHPDLIRLTWSENQCRWAKLIQGGKCFEVKFR